MPAWSQPEKTRIQIVLSGQILYRNNKQSTLLMEAPVYDHITLKEQQQLLAIARETIFEYVQQGSVKIISATGGFLEEHRGCFVTIKSHDKLRGCIGCFTSDKPLWATVQEMAIAAATKDPRFYPLHRDELDEISIEISVLSPLIKIESVDEIEVGT